MTAEQWLMLTDYASKYRISVSTLRRRIKTHQIPFRMEGGKYYILDAPPSHPEIASFGRETPIFPGLKTFAVEQAPLHTHSIEYPAQPAETDHWSLHNLGDSIGDSRNIGAMQGFDLSVETPVQQHEPTRPTQPMPPMQEKVRPVDEPLISTATKLLNELKQAYMSILHEKEEQIIQLKEEVSDLKTLVRVLEEDNERMRRILSVPHAR